MIAKEVIGAPECPILHRWTLLETGRMVPDPGIPSRKIHSGPKLMVHHFLANADDRDVHDHPRPFWTFVLWGSYDDYVPCPRCDGTGVCSHPSWHFVRICTRCDGRTVVVGERMRRGMLRRRPAHHRHRTRVGPHGCWTVVLMGPIRRRWGFWRDGHWWFWRDYEDRFGFGMRCED